VSDFQTGWKVLSAAIEEYAPETKLWWSPNVGSDADYEKYWPTAGRVDVVGFDWYPNEASTSFVDRAKPFHDKYATDGRIMCQGETGLHYTGTYEERMQWVKSLSSQETQSAMPSYVGWMWCTSKLRFLTILFAWLIGLWHLAVNYDSTFLSPRFHRYLADFVLFL
jgi:hypothetical protein